MASKKTESENEPEESNEPAIDVQSDEREGNDVTALLGSGAPQIRVRANVGWGCSQGSLRVGEIGQFVQTEEIRLNVQNGNLSVVE